MPKSFILSYVEDKMMKDPGHAKEPGPVITIARDYGCPGIHVAQEVTRGLTDLRNEWKMIDKEIINHAAQELRVAPEVAERIGHSAPRGFFHEFISAFSQQQNPSDAAVKRQMANAIRAFSLAGNVVILGRGGVVVTRDIKRSLHVKLYGPLAYRIERVKHLDHLTTDKEALEKIGVVDRERIYLRDYLAGEELKPDIFDIQFNCGNLTENEIVQTILYIARDKFGLNS